MDQHEIARLDQSMMEVRRVKQMPTYSQNWFVTDGLFSKTELGVNF